MINFDAYPGAAFGGACSAALLAAASQKASVARVGASWRLAAPAAGAAAAMRAARPTVAGHVADSPLRKHSETFVSVNRGIT